MEWQPIATAPKDGRDVLVFDDGAITIASWFMDLWWDHGEMVPEPTHWMPLPEPPK